jgi:pilus assembly protein Flp/PilA
MVRAVARTVVDFLKREDGPTAVEYAVMLALIIVVCIGAVTAIGGNTNATFNNAVLQSGLRPS